MQTINIPYNHNQHYMAWPNACSEAMCTNMMTSASNLRQIQYFCVEGVNGIDMKIVPSVRRHQVGGAVLNVAENLENADLSLGFSLVFVDVGHDLSTRFDHEKLHINQLDGIFMMNHCKSTFFTAATEYIIPLVRLRHPAKHIPVPFICHQIFGPRHQKFLTFPWISIIV